MFKFLKKLDGLRIARWVCALWLLIYVGFIGPALISAPNTFLVILGIVIGAALLYVNYSLFLNPAYYNTLKPKE